MQSRHKAATAECCSEKHAAYVENNSLSVFSRTTSCHLSSFASILVKHLTAGLRKHLLAVIY